LIRDKEAITKHYSGIKRQIICKDLRISASELNKVVCKFNARLKNYCRDQDDDLANVNQVKPHRGMKKDFDDETLRAVIEEYYNLHGIYEPTISTIHAYIAERFP
jgi:hypothetical protein